MSYQHVMNNYAKSTLVLRQLPYWILTKSSEGMHSQITHKELIRRTFYFKYIYIENNKMGHQQATMKEYGNYC